MQGAAKKWPITSRSRPRKKMLPTFWFSTFLTDFQLDADGHYALDLFQS